MGTSSPTALLPLQDICHHLALLECTQEAETCRAGSSGVSLSQDGLPGPPHTYMPPAMFPSPLSDKINRICQGVALEKCQPSVKEKTLVIRKAPGLVVT